MDPVSAAANIIAIIHAANKVVVLCKRFLEVVRDAPGDLRLILVEVSTLKAVLDDLHFLVSCNHLPSTLNTLVRDHGPIEGCRKVISELESLLPPESLLATDSKTKAILTALSWLTKESRAKTLIDELREYKITISLALTTDSSLDIKETKQNTEKIFAALNDVQERQVYSWLHGTDPSDIHERSRKVYEPGTGEWLFRSPEWEEWLNGKSRCLWVHGIPGAGKTVFASRLIEEVRWRCDLRGPSYACTYYYCYFGHSQDETVPLLRWVLLELCRRLGRVPVGVFDLYRHGGNPTVRGLLQALEQAVQAFDKVYTFIDAVDESLERENLLRVLQILATETRFENLRVLVTSREYMDIEETLLAISTPISMRNYLVDKDIALYIRSKLNSHPRLQRWPEQFREQAFQAIRSKANGMFRWVVCQIDALQRLKPEKRIIETALANLPRNLDETYERVFLQIPEEARSFVRHVFQWMSSHLTIHQAIPDVQPIQTVNFSPIYIPMLAGISLDILFAAVKKSLSADETCDPDFVDSYAFDEDLLRDYCGCLVTVMKHPIRDRSAVGETCTVSFAHYTVLEFLESPRIRRGPSAEFALDRQQVLIEHSKALILGAVKSADRWSQDWPEKRGPEFYDDFDRYCVHSAVLLLHWRAKTLHSLPTLSWLPPVIQLLETRVPTPLGSYFWFNEDVLMDLENPLAPSVGAFRQIQKLRMLSPPPQPHLEMLARMLQMDERGYLARSFLASLGRTSDDFACQVDLEFQPRACYVLPEVRMSREDWQSQMLKVVRFRGSMFEFYAQLPTIGLAHQGFYEMLEFAAGHFDPSTILLFAVANHQHNDEGPQCWGCHVLTKLLRLGAKATAPGFAVCAMQIAATRKDMVAMSLLLDAGFNPNDVGDPCGDIGIPERGPMLVGCRYIRGRSPLNIVKNGFSLRRRSLNTWYDAQARPVTPQKWKPIDGEVAALLLRHGGKDFQLCID
ncbi:hypothetical protein VTG60DRAFT_3476 [Thermothelomyces hinnuleus]